MLSIFGSRKLKPKWSFTPEATLWRVLFGGTQRIVGESRDTDQKTVSFFCLDETSGNPIWQNLRLEEPWWVGIEAVHGDVVVLHGFEKPDLPEHKKVFVHDLATGTERWRNLNLTFWFVYQDKLVGYEQRFDKRVGHVLELSSGKILESYQEGIEPLFPLRQLARQEELEEEFRFPEPLEEGSLGGVSAGLISKETKNESFTGTLEGIIREGYLLLSYYRYERGSAPGALRLENRFLIVDEKSGKPVFTETLQVNATAPVPDAFFMKKSTVYFVKDQRTLTAIELPKNNAE